VWDLRSFKSKASLDAKKKQRGGTLMLRASGDGSADVDGGKGVGRVTPIAVFTYHKAAITSLMWHWHDSSTFLASSRCVGVRVCVWLGLCV